MLRCRSRDKLALIQASWFLIPYAYLACSPDYRFPTVAEPTPFNPTPALRRYSYQRLYHLVADIASALLHHGLRPGDRVASYSSNNVVCHTTTRSDQLMLGFNVRPSILAVVLSPFPISMNLCELRVPSLILTRIQ